MSVKLDAKGEIMGTIISKKGQAKLNKDLVLEEVDRQGGLVREDELALLTGLSLQMTSRTVKALVIKGDLLRNRMTSGVWVRTKKRSGNTLLPKVPHTWRHDALAIFVVTKLAEMHQLKGQSEKEVRRRIARGKIADGHLINEMGEVTHVIEAEWSEKPWKPQEKMIKAACALAAHGIYTIFAYPAPMPGVTHQIRLNNAIKKVFANGEDETLKSFFIFVRCHFKTLESLDTSRPTSLDIVDIETGLPVGDFE